MLREPECQQCGACCLGGRDDGDGFAYCGPEDLVRMSPHVRRQLVHHRYWGAKGAATPVVMTEECGAVCAFLRGTPGQRVSCRIYETRPTVCREYPPGSNGCMAARAELGLDARLSKKGDAA